MLIFGSAAGFGQDIVLRTVAGLPGFLKESSGIENSTQGHFWMHNDGGDGPNLYKVDTGGNIVRIVKLNSAVNKDWEDITRDDRQNLYIADFGNNDNNRIDLKIYKIPDPDALTADTVTPGIIWFTYSNQFGFPPSDPDKNFDAEALVWFKDSLYIFTKNRTVPFDGFTYLYRIPDVPGMHIAELRDSFKTGSGIKEQWWVTAADLSPDQKKLVLLSSDKIFLFTDFSGSAFFKGKVKTLTLNHLTQKESLVFVNNDTFYVTDEFHSILSGQNLYTGSLGKHGKAGTGGIKKKDRNLHWSPAEQGIFIQSATEEAVTEYVLYDVTGKKLSQGTLHPGQHQVFIRLPHGFFELFSVQNGYAHTQRVVVY